MLNWTEGMESNYIYIKVSILLFYNYLFHTILIFLNVFSTTLPEICSMGINKRPLSPQASIQSPKQFLSLYNSLNCCWSSKLCPILVTPQTVACQAPLSMGFPKQEYWSGLPFPFSEDHPDPGIEPASPALAGGFFITEPPGKASPQNI